MTRVERTPPVDKWFREHASVVEWPQRRRKKPGATMAAENGATASQLVAILDWSTIAWGGDRMGPIRLAGADRQRNLPHQATQIAPPFAKSAKIKHFWRCWQEWQGSNLRPPVLETGALPIELHSYVDVAAERGG